VGATGVGLLLEEHRTEIATAWRQGVERELGAKDPALAFAVAPMLREMSLALGGDPRRASRDGWQRCAVLVRSTASPAQLAREFKLLHRAIWEALRGRGVPVSMADRAAADEWLQEALAEALDRLERVRIRAAALERPPAIVRPKPPPLPPRAARGRAAEAPARDPRAAGEQPIELEPASLP
jgi:hypothetical protein